MTKNIHLSIKKFFDDNPRRSSDNSGENTFIADFNPPLL